MRPRLHYLIMLVLLFSQSPGNAQQVHPVFYSRFNLPVNRIYNLQECGLTAVASDNEIKLFDTKSLAHYGSLTLLKPEKVDTRIRHIEYLKDGHLLAIIGEQVLFDNDRLVRHKDYLFLYDIYTLKPHFLPYMQDGIAALIDYKYRSKYKLPVLKNSSSLYQYCFLPATGSLYTIDNLGRLDVYRNMRLEKTLYTGVKDTRMLLVDDAGSAVCLTDDNTDRLIELSLPDGKIKHTVQLLSLPSCKNNEALYSNYKNYMVDAENGGCFILDSVNRLRGYEMGGKLTPALEAPPMDYRLTCIDWNWADSSMSITAENPTQGCKTAGGSISFTTGLYNQFLNGRVKQGEIGYVAYNAGESRLRIAVPAYGENETQLGKLLELPAPPTYLARKNYNNFGTWEQGYLNINYINNNKISIDVFQADSVRTKLLYSQDIPLNDGEFLAGIRTDTKWWITRTSRNNYTKGNMVVRIYDSLGKKIFSQTGHVLLQILDHPRCGQQMFSNNGKHMMLKEFLGNYGYYDSCRIRVYNTSNFRLEADVRFAQNTGDIAIQQNAFFDRNSNSFYVTALPSIDSIRTYLHKYDLTGTQPKKTAQFVLCADGDCRLPVVVHTIAFNHDNSQITFTGYVNEIPNSDFPLYTGIVRCMETREQKTLWFINLDGLAVIRKVLYFHGFIGLQSAEEIRFYKWVKDRFTGFDKLENFLEVRPVLNFFLDQFSNLYILHKPFAPPVYYERTGDEALISFRMGGRSFGRGFFDLSFNRPDEIIAAIPGGDNSYREQFHKAVLKRHERITNRAAGFDVRNIPEVTLIRAGSSGANIAIQLLIKSKDPVRRLRVAINGNVHYTPLDARTATGLDSFYYTLHEELTFTENNFEISAIDELNRESIPVSFVQNDLIKRKKPDMHALILSVGEYKYDTMLPWIVPDGDSLANLFAHKLNDTLFNRVNVKFLSDSEVNQTSITQWLGQLRAASPADYVIVFFNGHGVLNKQRKLLLLTSETPFKEPYHNAIDYQTVLDQLDSLPARQKLFLIDACHSGNFDEDNLDLGPGRQSNFDFMRKMFTFSTRGNGTFVFTSCAGNKRAVGPGGNTGPGPFIQALIEALADRRASQDPLGRIWVHDVFKYVTARTSELSNGLSVPDVKMINPIVNWRIK